MRVEPRSRRGERKRILTRRRRLILAAAALAAFSTVLPWGWTASIHDGDGQVILLLAAVGAFAAFRYREHRVGLTLASEAVLGAIVACTAVAHLAWGERGPGLALLLIALPTRGWDRPEHLHRNHRVGLRPEPALDDRAIPSISRRAWLPVRSKTANAGRARGRL